jgi:DNA (cytosine-5)-methyltransferase 1
MSKHKFAYRWNLSDGYPAPGIEYHGKKVFGTFICGGGSTMGYKLAGFEHLGGVEIDPAVAEVYAANHKPKHLYVEDIRKFVQRSDLPNELYDLDLLDGSPPCSSFSMAGNREKDWGKEKIFREGQAMQTLDDLFFDYIALAKKLQPKVVIAENVKGLIQGNAKAYVRRIKKEFEDAGYSVQLFLLNAASMGVPQTRERVFFVCQRKDIGWPRLVLNFNEKCIPFGDVCEEENGEMITGKMLQLWRKTLPSDQHLGQACLRETGKQNYFGSKLLPKGEVSKTVIANSSSPLLHMDKPYFVSKKEVCQIGSYPLDYNFQKVEPKYLIGMSVPPVMTAQIAHQIYLQWLSKIP